MNARTQTAPRTIVGADTQAMPGTAMAPKSAPAPLVAPKSSLLEKIPVSLPTREEAVWSIVGAIAGGLLWKRHRYLGVGLGLFVGKELKSVYENRKPSLDNVKNLLGPLAGVGAALAAQKYAPSIARRAYGLPTAAAAVAGMAAAGVGMSAAGLR